MITDPTVPLVGPRAFGKPRGWTNPLLQPEMPLPRGRRVAPDTGERRLMLAILQRAVDDYCTPETARPLKGQPKHLRPQALRHEAARWLFDDDYPCAVSCRAVCEAVGLELEAVRQSLARRRAVPGARAVA